MDPLRRALTAAADAERRRFEGQQARVRSSRVVHAVGLTPWMAGLKAPAPLCNTGVSGWDLSALSPTPEPVSCARCLARVRAGDGRDPETSDAQLTIFSQLAS